MLQERLLKTCVERMSTADVVYLTSIGADGYPRTRAMLNLRNREQYPDQVGIYANHDADLMTYVTTNTGSQKRTELEANPRICLYYCHPAEFFGVSLVGDVEIVDDTAIKESLWVDWWERYYPTGKADDPDFTLLRLRPIEVRGWNQSEKFAFELPS
jgi:general stress protein 26